MQVQPGTKPPEAKTATVERAAELIGVSRTTCYGLVMSGALRSLKIGARRLVPVSAIDEFIESQSQREGP